MTSKEINDSVEQIAATTTDGCDRCGGCVANKEAAQVDWQAEYLKKLNQDVSEIKIDMKNMESRLGDKIDTKLEEFRNEMRHLDNQRVEDMREIRNSLESTNKHVRNMASSVHGIAIAAIIGIAAIAVSVG